MKQTLFRSLQALGVNALFRRLNRGRIKVLLYHNIANDRGAFANAITPEAFDEHLLHLIRHYNIVGMDQAGQWQGYRADQVNVLITFDDGFINLVETAVPILRRHGISAVFFLIADCAETGAPPAFAATYGGSANQACYATVGAAEVGALLEAGMTIGSHSLRHDDFSAMEDAAMVVDARASRAKLEALCGRDVATFAFPWGKHREHQKALVGQAYERVFLTEHGFCEPGDRFVPRNEVDTLPQLQAAASGALDFLKGKRRER